MPLLILAVVFAVVQASPPVPRQAANPQTSQSTTDHSQSDARQNNPAVPIPCAQLPCTPQSKGKTAAEGQEDAEKTIRVRELPSVTVNSDWWSRAYVLLTAALVAIGFFGVRYARRSLRAINSQLEKMGQQVTEMQNAGIQTGQMIDRMKDTAERELRAYVCMESARIIFKRERTPQVHVYIRNFGKTPAYGVRIWIGGALGQYPPPEPLRPPPKEFPMGVSVLAPKAKAFEMIWPSPEIPEWAMPILGTNKFTIYVHGAVTYRDAFGKERTTKYRLIFGGREPSKSVVNEGGFRMGNMKTDTEGNEAD